MKILEEMKKMNQTQANEKAAKLIALNSLSPWDVENLGRTLAFRRFSGFMTPVDFYKFTPQEIADGNAFPFFALYPDEFPEFMEMTGGKVDSFTDLAILLGLSGVYHGADVVDVARKHGAGDSLNFLRVVDESIKEKRKELCKK